MDSAPSVLCRVDSAMQVRLLARVCDPSSRDTDGRNHTKTAPGNGDTDAFIRGHGTSNTSTVQIGDDDDDDDDDDDGTIAWQDNGFSGDRNHGVTLRRKVAIACIRARSTIRVINPKIAVAGYLHSLRSFGKEEEEEEVWVREQSLIQTRISQSKIIR